MQAVQRRSRSSQFFPPQKMDPSSAALYLLASKYFQIAAFVMLAYDHMLTLGQEVERIWMRPISFATILFLVNRYATLMEFTIIVVAFNDPSWKGESCHRFVLFEGTCSVALIAVGQMIIILRVVAIYESSKAIFAFLSLLWMCQIIISAVGLRTGFAAPLLSGLVGCVLTGSPSDPLFPSIWIAPLVTDSFIFLLTIHRTRRSIKRLFSPFKNGGASVTDKAVTILLRDGIMYYLVILLVNLMNALIYFLAKPDIKPIGASFGQLLTCTMISRLVLNLRSLSSGNQGHTTGGTAIRFNNQHCPSDWFGTSAPSQVDTIWTRTLNGFYEDDSSLTLQSEHAAACEGIPMQQTDITHHGNDHPRRHEV